MAKVRIKGDTSGHYDLTVPSVAGTNTIALANMATLSGMVSGNDFTVSGDFTASGLTYPTSDGTSGQFLKTDGSGNLGFETIDLSYRNGEIIEELWSLCDGGTLQGNDATVQSVTAAQDVATIRGSDWIGGGRLRITFWDEDSPV